MAQVVMETAAKHQPAAAKGSDTPADQTEGETTTEGEQEEPTNSEETPEQQTEGEEGPESTEDAEADLPFHKHPRFQAILKERNDSRAELEQLKPFAEQAQSLHHFCETNNITQEDFEGALELMRLAKNEPQAFQTKMQEMLDGMSYAAGSKLPPDLAEEVEAGTLSEARAKEIAQLRVQKDAERQSNAQRAQQAQRRAQEAITAALNTWEKQLVKTDPDYRTRQSLVIDRLKSLALEKPPRNPDEAIALAKQADADVRAYSAKFKPRARPTGKPLRSGGSSTNNGEPIKLDNLKGDLKNLVFQIAANHR